MKGDGSMTQVQERQTIEACSGCGAKAGLSWELPHPRHAEWVDLYCDACQAEQWLHDACEEAVIGALKRARIFDTFTMRHLQEVLDELSALGPEYLTHVAERGATARWRRRSQPVDRRRFDVDPDTATLSPADERHLLAAAEADDPGEQI